MTVDQGGRTSGRDDPRRADEGEDPTTLEDPSVAGLQKLRFDTGVVDGSDSEEKDRTGPFVSPVSLWSLDENEKVLSVAWEQLSGDVVLVCRESPLVRLVTLLTNDPESEDERVPWSGDPSEALRVDKAESEDTEHVALEIVGATLASLGAAEAEGEEDNDVADSLERAKTSCGMCWLLATKGVSSIELRDPDDENASGAGSESSTGVDAARSGMGNRSRCSSAGSFPP